MPWRLTVLRRFQLYNSLCCPAPTLPCTCTCTYLLPCRMHYAMETHGVQAVRMAPTPLDSQLNPPKALLSAAAGEFVVKWSPYALVALVYAATSYVRWKKVRSGCGWEPGLCEVGGLVRAVRVGCVFSASAQAPPPPFCLKAPPPHPTHPQPPHTHTNHPPRRHRRAMQRTATNCRRRRRRTTRSGPGRRSRTWCCRRWRPLRARCGGAGVGRSRGQGGGAGRFLAAVVITHPRPHTSMAAHAT